MATHARKAHSADRLWTEEEFLALPESTGRLELIDGEMVRQPSAHPDHQERVARIFEALRAWARTRTPRPDVWGHPLDLRLKAGRIVQPDVYLHLKPLPRPLRHPIEVIPDLCVEVVSRNRSFDRVTKRELYASAGVVEYWTVLPAMGFVERWTGERLATREELRERLVTPLLPGFELDVAKVLADA